MKSLLELITQQKIILISLGLVALPLVLALLLLLLEVIGKLRRYLSQRRTEKRAAQIVQTDFEDDDDLPEIDPAILALVTAPAVSVSVMTSKLPVAVENPQNTVSGASSGMNDLLASVFIDEDANDRYEILMRDVEPITTHNLVHLCQVIASEAYQHYPSENSSHKPEAS